MSKELPKRWPWEETNVINDKVQNFFFAILAQPFKNTWNSEFLRCLPIQMFYPKCRIWSVENVRFLFFSWHCYVWQLTFWICEISDSFGNRKVLMCLFLKIADVIQWSLFQQKKQIRCHSSQNSVNFIETLLFYFSEWK